MVLNCFQCCIKPAVNNDSAKKTEADVRKNSIRKDKNDIEQLMNQ